MKEKELVQAIKKHVSSQDDGWKFCMGREVLTKKLFLEKLDKDKKFRKLITEMVVNLSVDILTRKGGKVE